MKLPRPTLLASLILATLVLASRAADGLAWRLPRRRSPACILWAWALVRPI